MQRHSHHTVHWPTQSPSHQHFCRYLDSATALSRWGSGICMGIRFVLIPNHHRVIDISINTSIGPSCTWRLSDLPKYSRPRIELGPLLLVYNRSAGQGEGKHIPTVTNELWNGGEEINGEKVVLKNGSETAERGSGMKQEVKAFWTVGATNVRRNRPN